MYQEEAEGGRKLQKCKCTLRLLVGEAARGDTWGKSGGTLLTNRIHTDGLRTVSLN